MRKRKKWVVIIAVVLVISIGGYYWQGKKAKKETVTTYQTTPVIRGSLLSSVSASGNVIVDEQETVSPTITGTVAGLAVAVGDSVTKGQHLFSIINEQLSVEVIKAESTYLAAENSLASAELSVDEARANYDAAKKKDKKDGSTYTTAQLDVLEEKIDLAKREVEKAEKNLSSAEASLRNTKEDAGKREVTAPITGTINEVNIKNGDDLGKSSSSDSIQSPIIIGNMETLKVSVPINEVDISRLAIGQKATLVFDGIDGLTVLGKVEKIDSLGTANQGVVSYNVLLSMDSLNQKLKPQMSVTATIITSYLDKALLVPTVAIGEGESGESIVEVLENGIPLEKTVITGETDGTNTEIKSGLIEGEEVITETNAGTATELKKSSETNSNRSGGGIFPSSGGVRLPR